MLLAISTGNNKPLRGIIKGLAFDLRVSFFFDKKPTSWSTEKQENTGNRCCRSSIDSPVEHLNITINKKGDN